VSFNGIEAGLKWVLPSGNLTQFAVANGPLIDDL
jgi:hypothetical protein